MYVELMLLCMYLLLLLLLLICLFQFKCELNYNQTWRNDNANYILCMQTFQMMCGAGLIFGVYCCGLVELRYIMLMTPSSSTSSPRHLLACLMNNEWKFCCLMYFIIYEIC